MILFLSILYAGACATHSLFSFEQSRSGVFNVFDRLFHVMIEKIRYHISHFTFHNRSLSHTDHGLRAFSGTIMILKRKMQLFGFYFKHCLNLS